MKKGSIDMQTTHCRGPLGKRAGDHLGEPGQSRMSVNSMLGREAHLAFLDSLQFAVQFVLCNPHLFD